MLAEPFLVAVAESLGAEMLDTSPEVLESHGRDWTCVYEPNASAVAFPRTTEDVSTLLRLCSEHGVAVVPSGGRTGLAAGAVATNGELVLSLDKMNHIGEVCALARTVRVQGGAITAAVHEHCQKEGLTWPVDFASAGSSQIGGNIATNAGGVRVVRYGLTRQWVLGLQVVLMSGEVLELNGELEKNNTGIDLRQLFIGTEGTLGIITEATLQLEPVPRSTAVALLGAESLEAVLGVFEAARRKPELTIQAFEYLTHACLEVVIRHRGGAMPLESACPSYVLVEVEGDTEDEAQGALAAWLEEAFEQELILDGVVAQSSKDAVGLWAMREGISESLTREAFLYKYDVSVPVRSMAAFEADLRTLAEQECGGFPLYLFGHVGDGNLHLNVLEPEGCDRQLFLETCRNAEPAIFGLIQEYAGSVSAEHGIGLLKKKALPYSRTSTELALFQSIKRAFDPKGLMNPGKIID
ncbi:MAG: FAD-binding oxidoreductase [Myxococcota bacterium]|nr:FAD-binding oxidoreductase [Myxococcota bacterium]